MGSLVKLHLGCGKRDFGHDWIHIDGAEYPHVRYKDITDLPFQDDSVKIVYAAHVIEYFDREEVVPLLEEWVRVLEPEGILRLAVPDFKAMAELYVKRRLPLETFLGPLYGKMTMGDITIYHKTVYDYESLRTVLKNAGLKNIHRYRWQDTIHSHFDDHSQAYIPHMDKELGTLISLNMEGTK